MWYCYQYKRFGKWYLLGLLEMFISWLSMQIRNVIVSLLKELGNKGVGDADVICF